MRSRILLVGDDQLLREVIGEFLASKGYPVDIAETRIQALCFLEEGKYCLALIDHVRKRMSGVNMMKEIRQRDPEVFCLIMTGYSGQKAVSAAVGNGYSDYILKPFQLDDLFDQIQKHC
jgi:DNA-binding NtrC family response regulator